MKTTFALDFSACALSREGTPMGADEKASVLRGLERKVPRADLPGRCVLLRDPDPLRFALLYFHCLDAGYRPLPLAPRLPAAQFEAIRSARPDAFIWNEECWSPPTSTARFENCLTGDGTYACMTSGTTSQPKLCIFSVGGAQANAKAHALSMGIGPDSLLLQSLPIHHSFGLVCYLWTTLLIGCRLDFNPVFLTFKALSQRALQNGVLHVSPSQVGFLNREKSEIPPGISTLSVGGGLADAELLAAFRRKLPPSVRLLVSYGLTEAGPRVSTGYVGAGYARGYIGHALPGVNVTVRTEDGRLQPYGEGRLCVASPSLKLNLSPSELDPGGHYLITRDRVAIESSGEIRFLGREEDLINVGGVSVYAQDVEAVVRQHPEVRDCLVLKLSDPAYEEVPILFVETDAADPAVFVNFLAERLEPVQLPKHVWVLREFPRHSLDKIDRFALRALTEKESVHD